MAGTTNLLQWNPGQNNQESDAAYAADSTRANGAVDPTTFLSVLGNKAFYQWSTYLFALFTAFANKGYTTSDANVATLIAQCANFLTTADVPLDMIQVAYAATLVLNCSVAKGFQIILTGSVTSITFVGTIVYQEITIAFTQDSVGSRTVAWPSNVASPGVISSAPNSTSIQVFQLLMDGNFHPKSPMVVS